MLGITSSRAKVVFDKSSTKLTTALASEPSIGLHSAVPESGLAPIGLQQGLERLRMLLQELRIFPA